MKRHISTMGNIFDRLKKSLRQDSPADGDAVAADATPPESASEPANSREKGVDARRLAEKKAEEAGRRWRADAEAKGEVPKEIGGPQGLEPTRYGDWEKAGRCIDF